MEGIQTIADGAALQSTPTQEVIRVLVQQAMAQFRANMIATASNSHTLTKELVDEQIRTITFSADRAIANAQSERLLSKLADKFNLIASMQRNIG
ncbi:MULTISPECIES: hypothetical protein [Chelativorans]|jgi:hypothetical protein|uniref:hypothetical protein n=1 Tax=Chelativorans TaxID=449972 RepID=UPI0002D81455|nr:MULTISPECIES: hypothetical protein [Chelativorans]